jgi:hypothetical protein
MNDIDVIVGRIRDNMPDVQVVQMDKTHPGDDNGLWWFRLPAVTKDIQIESSTGECPFLIEHDDMKTSGDAITGTTVGETVKAVLDYLNKIRPNEASHAIGAKRASA